jgi:VanZ family protein
VNLFRPAAGGFALADFYPKLEILPRTRSRKRLNAKIRKIGATRSKGPSVARWLIWLLFVISWSAALEMPFPQQEHLPGGEFIITYKIIIAKSLHLGAYILLTVLSAWVPVKARYRWLMMFFLMVHAWGSEMLQDALKKICFRTGSLEDVGIDVIGIIIGVAISWKWWTRD